MNPLVHSVANWWYIRPARRMIREMQGILDQSKEEEKSLGAEFGKRKDPEHRPADAKIIQEQLTRIKSVSQQVRTLGQKALDSVERGLRWLKPCGHCRHNLGQMKTVLVRLTKPSQSKAAP